MPFEEVFKASPGKEVWRFPKLPTWARLDKTERLHRERIGSEQAMEAAEHGLPRRILPITAADVIVIT